MSEEMKFYSAEVMGHFVINVDLYAKDKDSAKEQLRSEFYEHLKNKYGSNAFVELEDWDIREW